MTNIETATTDTPTLVQWARAEALKAIMSQPGGVGWYGLAEQVNAAAELILTGSLPVPAGDETVPCPKCAKPSRLSKFGAVVRHNDPQTGLPCDRKATTTA